jgi:hypothetical protein
VTVVIDGTGIDRATVDEVLAHLQPLSEQDWAVMAAQYAETFGP